MPTAESFNALGAGNGFVACLRKVDVSGYDHWTTLNGVNKNSPTTSDALIAESLQLGMKLYWNLFSCVALTNVTFSSDGALPSESSSVSNLDLSSSPRAEPMDRICGGASVADSQSSTPSGRTNCHLRLTASTGVRMYNGVTTDEDNFVGMGYNSGEIVNTRGSSSNRAVSRVTLVGYRNESTNQQGVYDYAYVTLGGLHFTCEARADGNDSESANAASLTASATGFVSPVSTVYRYSSTSTITSLDFYTY